MADAALDATRAPGGRRTLLAPGLGLKLLVLAILGLLIVLPLVSVVLFTLSPEARGAWGDVLVGRLAPNLFWEPLANTVLIGAVTDAWDMRFRSPLARQTPSKAGSLGTKERMEEHGRILRALEAHDPVEARAAMRDHLTRVIDHLLHVDEVEAVERVRAETAQRRRASARRAV